MSLNKYLIHFIFLSLIALFFSACGASIHSYAKKGNPYEVMKRVKAGENINSHDKKGWTALTYAVDHNDLNFVKILLQNGANPNINTNENKSPLMMAAYKGNIKLAKLLIKYGADVNALSLKNEYALYLFVVSGFKKNDPKESLSFVKWLIEEKKADYKMVGYNKYTLIHASTNIKLTEYLIGLGMDIKSLSGNSATTLMGSLAFFLDEDENEDISVPKYLIERCIDLKHIANFSGNKVDALSMAQKFEKTKALALIKEYLENPPKQCLGEGILAPVLSFYNMPETFDSENVNISIQLQAQGYGVGDVFLFVNGSEISPNKSRALIKRAGLRVRTYSIKLQNGLNEIKAYAYDNFNKVRSIEIVHNVVARYETDDKPKLYAVAIGIDEFEDKSLNLKYAEADATLFGSTIFKRSKEIFSKVNIEYMKKKEGTTKEVILNKLKSLKDISANDFFVFYSATHGVQIDGKYYMITSNVSSTDKYDVIRDSISEDELREAIRQIPTANKLLLFDTCYSGAVNEKISKELAKSTVDQLNLTSITAANSAQTALEGFADGHGIFTYVLSDALDGEADIDGDGLVQSMELVNYANKMVPKEAKKFNHIQTPAYFQSGQVFNVAKLRSYKGKIDMKPQYFKPKEVKKLVAYMDKNDVTSLRKLIITNKKETKKKVEKIIKQATKIEAKKAAQTLKKADKKFSFGQHSFIFNDNSIFLDIKDKIKEHFNFTDHKGRHLVVFDFYSDDINPRVVQSLDTDKVSDIYMADRGDWYRVTLQTKTKQSYEQVINKNGVFIKLKNKKLNKVASSLKN